MKLKVPYHKQETTYTCAIATLRMILDFLGIKNHRNKLVKGLKPDKEEGVPHGRIIEFIREVGLYSYVNNESDIDEIKYYLKEGNPVIVNYLDLVDNEGHYSIIVGFEEHKFILNDPWNGEGFEIGFKDFEKRWRSGFEHGLRWLMVVSKEPFHLGRQYKPDNSM